MTEQSKILIFVEERSARLDYIAAIFFGQLLGLKVQITSDFNLFENTDCPTINYSNKEFLIPCLSIARHHLLFENTIKPQQIQVKQEAHPVFFELKKSSSDIKFDVLAMSFYLLSRYEEYLPFEMDIHERFTAKQSLAYQQRFLEKPLINLWAIKIGTLLKEKFPAINIQQPVFQCLPTYDIDMAWAYLHRPFWRMIGATTRDFFKNRSSFQWRLQTFLGKQQDPFDTFDFIIREHQKRNLPAHFFFLVGKYGKYDKNSSPESKAMQQLILRIHQLFEIGIHPSYQSNIAKNQLQTEQQQLSAITNSPIQKSRQHFLKICFPRTYQNLLAIGIKEDYTMGYASAIGFRASIATPFPWFDLERNEATDLMIYPFQVMDVTLKNYLQLSPEEATLAVEKMINACREVGGLFIPIWHNSSLSKLDDWESWRVVFQKMLDMGKG